MHIELFLEEPSAEAFMQGFLPKVLPGETTWNPIVFQGKPEEIGNVFAEFQKFLYQGAA